MSEEFFPEVADEVAEEIRQIILKMSSDEFKLFLENTLEINHARRFTLQQTTFSIGKNSYPSYAIQFYRD